MDSKPVPRREIFSWALYDFANSAFATTILAVIMGPFLEGKDSALHAPEGTWGYANSLSPLIVAAITPILGAICDFSAAKKRALIFFWLLGSFATLGLFFHLDWKGAVLAFLLANIGFEASTSIYNSFLPEIAPGEKAVRISSLGWACGYIGGGLHLFLGLLVMQHPEWLGAEKGQATIRIVLGSVGIWWLVFALPMVFWLKERAVPRRPEGGLIASGFKKVFGTLRSIRRFPTLARFTVAFMFFNDGLTTVIIMASAFGQGVLGMSNEQLIKCFLLIQGVAFVGSMLFAWLAGRFGDKPTLVLTLFIWCGVIGWAFVMRTQNEYWVMGIIVGLVMGGTQAIARSLQSKFTPPSCAGEFFGFFAITGKAAAALGPAMYATVLKATGGNQRYAILSIVVQFVIGLILLWPVSESKGVAEAEAEELRLKSLAGPGGTATHQ